MSGQYVLENVSQLYTGKAGDKSALLSSVDVLVKDGRFAEIRAHTPGHYANLPKVACKGLTVTPGLIDCHGHITILGLSDEADEIMSGHGHLVYVEKILHLSLVEGGVTTMRDIGGATDLMKRLVNNGTLIGPRLKIAICMLSTTGGHADSRGPDRCHAEIQKRWGPMPGRPAMTVDGPWECRQRVREIIACGADLIKVCTSGGIASPSDKLTNREFTCEELEAIVDEAHNRGLRVAAHAHSEQGIEMAIKAGVHDLQHVSFLNERLTDMAHKCNCTVTPTSWVLQSLPTFPELSEFSREKSKIAYEAHQNAVKYAKKGGLKILAGSDPVLTGMHGRNFLEIHALIRDGLNPLEAWHSMTGLAAGEISQQDAGTIEVGQRADFLICEGDVLNKPEHLGHGGMLEVVKDGVGYRGHFKEVPQTTYRSNLQKLLEETTAYYA